MEGIYFSWNNIFESSRNKIDAKCTQAIVNRLYVLNNNRTALTVSELVCPKTTMPTITTKWGDDFTIAFVVSWFLVFVHFYFCHIPDIICWTWCFHHQGMTSHNMPGMSSIGSSPTTENLVWKNQSPHLTKMTA